METTLTFLGAADRPEDCRYCYYFV